MAGKPGRGGQPGRSGRRTTAVESGRRHIIDEIKDRTHNALSCYIRYVERIAQDDPAKLTQVQSQQLVTLHIKYVPNAPGESEDKALGILERMATEGMREYARIKAKGKARTERDIMANMDINIPTTITTTITGAEPIDGTLTVDAPPIEH